MMTFTNLGRLGRFANGAFQIAGTIGIAVQSGQSYAFPKWINHDALDRFGTKEDINLWQHFINPLPELPANIDLEEYPYFWGYRYINLPTGNWNFNAHFQSPKYFTHCMKLVRWYFTMADEEDHDATAIHMRFGDYDDSYHPRPRVEYYREALQHVPLETPLFVFSDDLDAAHKIMAELDVKYIPIEKGYLDSFRIMKRCKHFIVANSSYSMMAALLADQPGKIVVAPKKWFGPAWGNPDEMSLDMYPENCIII